jgi:hypothetical protein
MFAEKGFQGSDSWATLEYSVPDRIPPPASPYDFHEGGCGFLAVLAGFVAVFGLFLTVSASLLSQFPLVFSRVVGALEHAACFQGHSLSCTDTGASAGSNRNLCLDCLAKRALFQSRTSLSGNPGQSVKCGNYDRANPCLSARVGIFSSSVDIRTQVLCVRLSACLGQRG